MWNQAYDSPDRGSAGEHGTDFTLVESNYLTLNSSNTIAF